MRRPSVGEFLQFDDLSPGERPIVLIGLGEFEPVLDVALRGMGEDLPADDGPTVGPGHLGDRVPGRLHFRLSLRLRFHKQDIAGVWGSGADLVQPSLRGPSKRVVLIGQVDSR